MGNLAFQILEDFHSIFIPSLEKHPFFISPFDAWLREVVTTRFSIGIQPL